LFLFFSIASLLGILIFFGAIIIILVTLIITYFCVKDGECCWDKTKKKKQRIKAQELSNVADGFADDEKELLDFESDNGSFFNKPYLMSPQPTNRYKQLVNESEYGEDPPTRPHTVVFLENVQLKTKRGKQKSIPESVKSVATGYTSTEEDTDSSENPVVKQNQQKTHRAFVQGSRIRFSLLYSKKDMFLMLTINEVEGIPPKSEGGFDFVQVSVTLLPKKKYRSKTKLVFQSESHVLFDESFKFSNISRDKLFSSAFRIRVQSKKMRRNVTLGEVVVHLADVAQRAGGFMTWRNLDKVKR